MPQLSGWARKTGVPDHQREIHQSSPEQLFRGQPTVKDEMMQSTVAVKNNRKQREEATEIGREANLIHPSETAANLKTHENFIG